MNARFLVSAALTTLCLAVPAAASAATRYAEPGGNGPEPCLLADPCDIHHAAEGHVDANVVNGDEIILLPGDYTVTDGVALGDQNLSFHGQTGQPRPRILSTAPNASSAGVFVGTAGVQVSHLEIEQSGDSAGLITNSGAVNVTVEDVRVHTSNPTAFTFTCQLSGTVTLRNSVCWNSSFAGAGVGVNTSGGRANVTLRNVTAISTAPKVDNSFGIYYSGNNAGTTLSATATNVIADGVTADIYASASSGASSAVTLDHSNYDAEYQAGTATITDPGTGTNQTAAPLYLDAATGGFHQAPGSPTIDQGADDAANGSFDIDLEPRTAHAATDIGADEFFDLDGDGNPDDTDNCPNDANADQADIDGDGRGDACDPTDDRPAPPPVDTPPVDTPPVDTPPGGDSTPPDGTTTEPGDNGNQVDPPAADTVAPDTIVDSAPAKGHQKRRMKVVFHATEAGSRFECSLDGKAFTPCSSPVNLRASAGRRHRLEIRAIDAAGNVDQTPAVVRWRVRAR